MARKTITTAAGWAASVALVAGCHLIGGTNGLYIESAEDVGGSAGIGAQGGAGGASSSVTTSGTGGGGSSNVCNPMDCPMPTTSCALAACVNNECGFTFEPPATPCSDGGGAYCDGVGNCVECTENAHCPSNGACQQHVCYAASCNDTMMNGNETGIDCGGTCGGCTNGNGCNVYTDCASLVCAGNTCVPCAMQPDCPATHYCKDGGCLGKKGFGSVCGNDYECLSNNCTGIFLCGL